MIILEQGPIFSEEVASYYMGKSMRGGSGDLTVSAADHKNSLENLRTLEHGAGGYIETFDFFCAGMECPSRDPSGALIIYDTNHLTKEYSRRLAAYALEKILLTP